MTTSPHIRLVAMGTRGDVQPYVALGLGLKRAGYNVSLGVTADFREFVESHGLACTTVDMDMKALVSRAGGRSAKWAFLQMLMDATLALSQGADVLIYGSALTMTAPHVAEKLKAPMILALLQPYLNPTRQFPAVGFPSLPLGGGWNLLSYSLLNSMVWTFTKSRINRWRKETLGLPAYEGPSPFLKLRDAVPTLYGFSPAVLPRPEEWGSNVHITGYWFLPQADASTWQPPAGLTEFLEAGSKPVYIGFGSMSTKEPQKTTEIVLDAVKQAGVRAVIATGWQGMTALSTPKDVYVLDSISHDWLFPRIAAAVHHGGAGTTGASLRAGLPTVIVPHKGDQPYWGQRVYERGAGPKPLPFSSLSAPKLAEAIKLAVNDESIRAKATAIGATIRAEDGVGEAVRVVGKIISNS